MSDAAMITLEAAIKLLCRAYELEVVGNEAHLVKPGYDPVQITMARAESLKPFITEAKNAWDNFLVPEGRSTHLEGYRYNPKLQLLEVRFLKEGKPGALYRYLAVKPEEFDAFHTAGSLTAHLNTVLRVAPGREYEQVKETAPVAPDLTESLRKSIDAASGVEAGHPPTVSTPVDAPKVVATAPTGKDGEPVQATADAPTESKEYAILGFYISGLMRINVVDVALPPGKGMVIVTGKNAQGKSSLCDGIQALCGQIPARVSALPINDNFDRCDMRMTIGKADDRKPLYEWRRWREREDAQWGYKVVYAGTDEKVKNTTASAFMKEFLVNSFIVPQDFIDCDPRDRRARLARLGNVHLDEEEAALAQAKQAANDLESEQKTLEAQAKALPSYPEAPDSEHSIVDLSNQLQAAIQHNQIGSKLMDDLTEQNRKLSESEREVAELEAKLATARRALTERTAARDNLEAKFTEFIPQDVARIQTQMSTIEETNRQVRANQAKAEARAKWEACEGKLGAAIAEVKKWEQAKRKKLEAATFPVEGLGFDDNDATFNGRPWAVASDAEKLRCAIAISEAERGALLPIRVNDAAKFDNDYLRLIADEAQRKGTFVFAEIPDGRLGDERLENAIYIHVEDGRIAETEAEAA